MCLSRTGIRRDPFADGENLFPPESARPLERFVRVDKNQRLDRIDRTDNKKVKVESKSLFRLNFLTLNWVIHFVLN